MTFFSSQLISDSEFSVIIIKYTENQNKNWINF